VLLLTKNDRSITDITANANVDRERNVKMNGQNNFSHNHNQSQYEICI